MASRSQGHESPTVDNQDVNVADVLVNGRSQTQLVVEDLQQFVKRVDSGAVLLGVNKTCDSTLVRISLSEQTSAVAAIALRTAVSISYPLCTTSIVESATDGNMRLHVLLHTAREEYRQASALVAERPLVRLVNTISKSLFLLAGLSFSCLLYASVISPQVTLES